MAIGTGAAILGGAALAGATSLIGGSKQSSAIRSAASSSESATLASIDAQREALEKSISAQMQQYYQGLQQTEPWRYAGAQALESLQRELYGQDYMAPWGENFQRPTMPSEYQYGGSGREGVTSSPVSAYDRTGLDRVYDPRTTARPMSVEIQPTMTGTRQYTQAEMDDAWQKAYQEHVSSEDTPDSFSEWMQRNRSRTWLLDKYLPKPGYYTEPVTSIDRSGALTPISPGQTTAQPPATTGAPATSMESYYQHAPVVRPELSPLYQVQLAEAQKTVDRLMASRGLFDSGAAAELTSDYTRKLAATDALRQQGLMETLAGYGTGSSQAALQASMALGQGLGSTYGQYGANVGSALLNAGTNRANLALAGGQNQANMYTNLANIGMGGLNAYLMNQGLNNYYGGGLNPYAGNTGGYMWNLGG